MAEESTEDEGKAQEIKREIKRKAGRATSNLSLEEEGEDREIEGTIQK